MSGVSAFEPDSQGGIQYRQDEYPPLREIRAHVCAACIAREGSECHTPGCMFWMHSVEELPPNLDIYVDPPADIPSTLTPSDVAVVCERYGLVWNADAGEWQDDNVRVERSFGLGRLVTVSQHVLMQGRRPIVDLFYGADTAVLVAAIQAARSAS